MGTLSLSVRRMLHVVYLNATEYSSPSLFKDNYARKAQFGQIFTFDKKTAFRTSPRGWYSFYLRLNHYIM